MEGMIVHLRPFLTVLNSPEPGDKSVVQGFEGNSGVFSPVLIPEALTIASENGKLFITIVAHMRRGLWQKPRKKPTETTDPRNLHRGVVRS